MGTGTTQRSIATGIAMLATLTGAEARAQRIADWPVRVSVGAEATVNGVGAVFWNPAALSYEHRLEGVVVDLRTPAELGLRSMGAAVSYRVERSVFALGYRHADIGELTRTEDSPIGDNLNEFSVGEDELIIAAAHRLGSVITAGATGRYLRANYAGANEDGITVGAGINILPPLPLPVPLQVAAYVLSESDQLAWVAGVEAVAPPLIHEDYRLRASYGARRNESDPGVLHRLGASLEWRDRASVSGGMAYEPDVSGGGWHPAVAATLRLSRYTVGVVRETLPNGFGAAWALRLQLGW